MLVQPSRSVLLQNVRDLASIRWPEPWKFMEVRGEKVGGLLQNYITHPLLCVRYQLYT